MNDQGKHWLLRKENIRKLWIVFIVILAATVVTDFFVHLRQQNDTYGSVVADVVVHKHATFGIEGTFGFYAWYGFITCVGMVVFAKLLGVLLKRPENYYDTESGAGTDKVEVDHD